MTDPPNLDLVNLVVSDMEATVAFYRRLGERMEDRRPSGGRLQGRQQRAR